MASGTLGAEESREKPRRNENNKVYTRKKRNKNNATTTDDAAAAAAINNNENGTVQKDESAENVDGNAITEANSHQKQQNLPRIEVVSGDASSLNPQDGSFLSDHDNNVGNESALMKPVITRIDNEKVRISFSSARFKHEKREIKRKLVCELEEVKSLAKMLQYKEAQLSRYSDDQIHSNYSTSDGLQKNGGFGFYDSRPFQHLSVKSTSKANQYYRSSDFICGTGKIPPPETNKKLKVHKSKKQGGGSAINKQIFKKCASLNTKLMKHQFGWVFNTPVDVKWMGLHDYYDIIKYPMDLGTVKSRLSKNWYKSPSEFAEDVRRTFRNAMIYNPEGQDVHIMAMELANVFEEKWVEIEAEYNSKLRFEVSFDYGLPIVSALPNYQETRHLDRSEPFALQKKPVYNQPVVRTPSLKKPKAKDLNKREMTFEEKQKLSGNLQALPSEKLDSIVQVIKRRNSTLSQHDDEIEVDIDSVDAETLWELDRFVINYKTSLSKHKRKAELARQRAEVQQKLQNPVLSRDDVPNEMRIDDTDAVCRSSSVHERKEADDNSGSSSSSSDSGSSSSESDSDSSSGSDSNGG